MSSDCSSLKKTDVIYIAGHSGMVGSATVRLLRQEGYRNLLYRTSAELDLRDQSAVRTFFSSEKIDYVVLAAARVGGIHANNSYPGEFIYQNLMIQTNVIHEAFSAGVEKGIPVLVFSLPNCSESMPQTAQHHHIRRLKHGLYGQEQASHPIPVDAAPPSPNSVAPHRPVLNQPTRLEDSPHRAPRPDPRHLSRLLKDRAPASAPSHIP